MIYVFTPYSLEGNYGEAQNKYMDLINDDDWAVIIDHDVMVLSRDWLHLVDKVIRKYPEFGLFTCYSNRVGTNYQKAPGVNTQNHDILYHVKFAKNIRKKFSSNVTEIRLENRKKIRFSGYFIVVSKKTWNKIGGVELKGMSGIDWNIAEKCVKNKIKIGRMDGLYVYHYRRGLGEKSYG